MPAISNLVICATGPLRAIVDVYSERGVLIAEIATDTSGTFAIRGLKHGSYTLVASAATSSSPFPGLTGSYEMATQSVSIRNKTSVAVDFVLVFVPSGT